MPFNYDNFISSPLTGVGLGLLSMKGGEPIGTGITKGLLMAEGFRNSIADRQNQAQQMQHQQAQEQRLGEYQQALTQNQVANLDFERQKMAMSQNEAATEQKIYGLISQGDIEGAFRLNPVTAAKAVEAIRGKQQSPSALQEKIDLIQKDPNLYKQLFPPAQGPQPQETWSIDPSNPNIQISSRGRREPTPEFSAQKPPSGYRVSPADPTALEPIPGGPASVRPGGSRVLPASQVEALADMKALQKTLQEAEEIAQAKKVETGPVVGRKQAALALVGGASDDFIDVSQRFQTAQNIMLKLRSGAVVTESEYNRFLKEFPTVNDPPAARTRKAKNASRYAADLLSSKVELFSESGYKVPESMTKDSGASGWSISVEGQ